MKNELDKIVKGIIFKNSTGNDWINKNLTELFDRFNKPLTFKKKIISLGYENIFKFGNANIREISDFLDLDGDWYIEIMNHGTNRIVKTKLNKSIVSTWLSQKLN
jgi:hypothetical protein